MRLISFSLSIFFLFFSCAHSKCVEGEGYSQLKKLFNAEGKSFDKGGEKEFKRKLLQEICSMIGERKKVLLIEQINIFSGTRQGLIYVFDDKGLYFFLGEKGNKIQLGKGDNKFLALKEIMNRVKPDFINEAKKLKERFEKLNIKDASLLQILLMDVKEQNLFFEFPYSPDYVID